MQDAVTSLLTQQVQCVLATQGKQGVALHLMAYAFSANLAEIYLASLAGTQKVSNMRDNPKVTCLWDNRTGNHADHVKGFAMSGFGQVCELNGQAAHEASRLLLNRNTSLNSLLSEPSVVIFAIDIHRYQWVEGYTKSISYKPKYDLTNMLKK